MDTSGDSAKVRVACAYEDGEAGRRCLKSASGYDIEVFTGDSALVLCPECPRVVKSVVVERSGDCRSIQGTGPRCAGVEEPEAQLHDHLTMCRELLEIEPGSRWALLTEIYLLGLLHEAHEARDINTMSVNAADEAGLQALRDGNLEIKRVGSELIEVDATRRSYYADVMSRADLRLACALAARTVGSEVGMCGWSLTSLSAPSLVRLIGIRVLDVSDNELTDLHGIEMLYGLEKLTADGCRLGSTGSLTALAALARLAFLSIRRNGIACVAPLLQPLAHLAALASVDVAENAGAVEAPGRIANFDVLR